MKKIILLGLSLSLCSLSYIHVNANEKEVVCHYETDENGEEVYVCEEVEGIQPYIVCTPECWGV